MKDLKTEIINDFFTKNFKGEIQKYEENEVFKNMTNLYRIY